MRDFEDALVRKNNDTEGRRLRRATAPDDPNGLGAYWDWHNNSPNLNDNFALLEVYQSTERTPNVFLEVIYPNSLNTKNNIPVKALETIQHMAKAVVAKGRMGLPTDVPDFFAAWLLRIGRARFRTEHSCRLTRRRYRIDLRRHPDVRHKFGR